MKKQRIGSTTTTSSQSVLITIPDLDCFWRHCNLFGDCHCMGSGHNELTEEGKKRQNLLLRYSEAMDSLTEVEKDRVYSDMYGTADAIEESEAFVNGKMHDLQDAIDEMSIENKTDYLLALNEEIRQGTTYVQSQKFVLMFLRAARFNITEAAAQMCNFFRVKKELFGIKKLPRRIVESDLGEDDKETLYSGSLFICSGIDHCNRMALFFRRQEIHFKNIINFKRCLFYYITSAIEDNENAQKMGIMQIFYDVGPISLGRCQLNLMKNYKSVDHVVMQALPFRTACVHHCYSDWADHILASLILTFQKASNAARVNSIFGSHQHCCRELVKYGICVDLFPVNRYGIYDHQTLKRSLKKLGKKEKEKRQTSSCRDNNYPMLEPLDDSYDDSSIGSY